MRNPAKKIIALLLALLMTSGLCAVAFAEGEEVPEVSDFLTEVDDIYGGLTITGFTGELAGGVLEIPETVDGIEVTSIGDYLALESPLPAYLADLEILIIPQTVRYIGMSAFEGLPKLTEVIIYSSDIEIGAYAFFNDAALTGVWFDGGESGVTTGLCAFEGTGWYDEYPIDWIVVGNTLVKYKGLDKYVKMPVNVTAIGPGAFLENDNVETVELTANVDYIGDYAFKGASNLKTLVIPYPNQLNYVGFDAFDDTAMLDSFEGEFFILGSTLIRYLGSSDTVYIPNTVTAVAPDAFKGAYKLSEDGFAVFSIRVPASVTIFGDNCFTLFDEDGIADIVPFLFVVAGSAAESYAKDNGIGYEIVGIPGDVDLDGKVTPADARLALRHAVGFDEHLGEAQLVTANVDNDDKISAADARLIIRIAVGIIKSNNADDGPTTAYEMLDMYKKAVANAARYGAGYTKLSYQELAEWNLDANTSLYINDWKTKGITVKDDAKAKTFALDSADAKNNLPPATLLDTSVIENFSCTYANGRYTIALKLKPETISGFDPDGKLGSYTGKLFGVPARASYDSSIKDQLWYKAAANSLTYDMVYENCVLVAVVNAATGNLENLRMQWTAHLDNIDGSINGLHVASKGRKTGTGDIIVKDTTVYSDFVYFLDAPEMEGSPAPADEPTTAAPETTTAESFWDKINIFKK